jgi:tetratricopeptide (TPR) repeat protein
MVTSSFADRITRRSLVAAVGTLSSCSLLFPLAPVVASSGELVTDSSSPDEATTDTAFHPESGVTNPAPPRALPSSYRLEGFRHQWQTWNNCGPATITMATSHFGRPELQAQAAAFLKPNPDDKNVNPDELVAYARSVGLRADWLVAGDLDRLKALVANGVPVVVETWYTPRPGDGLGHYRLLVGYDDGTQQLIFFDSFQAPGVNLRLPYSYFDENWRVFNRSYIPVYPAEKAPVVAEILGSDRDDTAMHERALVVAQAEVSARPNDAYSWFNVGTNLVSLGRHAEAAGAFDRARSLRLPSRMFWYQFGPFEAYLAAGRPNDVLALANANLQQTRDLEESLYYRGRALEAMGQSSQARASYQEAARVNPMFSPALHAVSLLG